MAAHGKQNTFLIFHYGKVGYMPMAVLTELLWTTLVQLVHSKIIVICNTVEAHIKCWTCFMTLDWHQCPCCWLYWRSYHEHWHYTRVQLVRSRIIVIFSTVATQRKSRTCIIIVYLWQSPCLCLYSQCYHEQHWSNWLTTKIFVKFSTVAEQRKYQICFKIYITDSMHWCNWLTIKLQ